MAVRKKTTAKKGAPGAPVRKPKRKKKPLKPGNKNTRRLMKQVDV